MGFWLTILASTLGVVIFSVLRWLILPVRHRAAPTLMRITKDHGLTVRVFSTADETLGLLPRDMLDLDPAWLVDDDFYLNRSSLPGGPARRADWITWAGTYGAERVGWRHVLIQVQSTQDRAVLLMRPRVNVHRTDVSDGFIVGPEREPGGNGIMCRQFDVELDAPQPVAKYYSDDARESAQFSLAKGQTEAFLIIAHAEKFRCEWTLTLDATVDGEQVELDVDDHGSPFVTIGAEGLERRWWHFNDQRWLPEPWYPDQ